MRFQVLGPVEVRDGQDHLVPIKSVKIRSLLAILLLHDSRPATRKTAIQRVWPDGVPADNTIDGYVTDLRRIVQKACNGAAEMPKLKNAWQLKIIDTQRVCVDLHVFTRELANVRAAAQKDQHDEVVRAVRRAFEQWHGTPLDRLDGDWVLGERNKLEEQRHLACHRLLDAELRLGRHLEVLEEIGEPRALWPTDQTLIQQHTLALYRGRRQSDALAVFRGARQELIDVGVEPGDDLRQLHDQILRGDASLATPAVSSASRATAQPVPTALDGLPAQSVFVGRDAELAGLADFLAPDREDVGAGVVVVSAVAGQAGIGKTALVARTAHDARDAGWFPGGVLFANLHGYDPEERRVRPEQVLAEWLRALGVADEHIPVGGAEREALYRSELATRAIGATDAHCG